MRALVADDDPSLRDIMTTMLVDDGHAVAEARTGTEAISLMARTPVPYDVALLDLAMPDGTGVDVAEYARREQSPTKLILVSAYGREFQHMYPDNDLFDAVVPKPFTLIELEHAVEKVTGKVCQCHPN